MIDLQTVASAGTSTTAIRWLTNPARRILWLLARPYFAAFAKETERALLPAQAATTVQMSAVPALPDWPQEAEIVLFVPPGHYYSPIVNPDEVRASGFSPKRESSNLLGIDCDMPRMRETFLKLASSVGDLDFPEFSVPGYRYYFTNDMFWHGGALILAGMIRNFRPKRIMEVGSGFSSAVILDTLDHTPGMEGTKCTFIEPNQGRLRSILRSSDADRVRIINRPVQDVPVSDFESLESGDLLFLDTTHIVKTGSDVVFELFEVLPRLASGVLIHFHDVMAGFEYDEKWIFDDNRSWNEIYALRAFLMYNTAFEIVFFTAQFLMENRDLVRTKCPQLAERPDGGLWIRKK